MGSQVSTQQQNNDGPAIKSNDKPLQQVPSKPKTTQPKKKKMPPPNLTGFALVEYNCRKVKRKYDICSRQKHSAFVIGKNHVDRDGDEEECDDLFEVYKRCVFLGMKSDREKRNVGKPTHDSALGDFEDELEDDNE